MVAQDRKMVLNLKTKKQTCHTPLLSFNHQHPWTVVVLISHILIYYLSLLALFQVQHTTIRIQIS